MFQYPADRELLAKKAKKAAKEIAEKQNAGKAERIDTTDVLIPSRPRHSMAAAAEAVVERRREVKRKMEEKRRRAREEEEREKRRSKARQAAIMGMRK